MKRPTPASLKKVTAENLLRLGPERLAEILLEVAETRVELKRRLRMELAAQQGPEQLLAEIDRRLGFLAGSRGVVSWRQRPAFVRDLEGVRVLISGRLAALDLPAAQDRILVFLSLSAGAGRRARDREGHVDMVFARAANDAVELLSRETTAEAGARLAAAIAEQPEAWGRWAAGAFGERSPETAVGVLRNLPQHGGPAWTSVLRCLADIAGDPDAFRATVSDSALKAPSVAAQVAARFLKAGRLDDARAALEAAVGSKLLRAGRSSVTLDEDWESVWIDWLDAVGRTGEAQEARWTSFERSLSVERARAFAKRLPDFDDVEAEARMIEIAARHPDANAALAFFMDWPALPAAADHIANRSAELSPEPDRAEAWARKLRRRHPAAAERILRRAAAEAFRHRAFKTADRLTEEADSLGS